MKLTLGIILVALFASTKSQRECQMPPHWTINGEDLLADRRENVTLLAFLDAGCGFCLKQAAMLDLLKTCFQDGGYPDINFLIVNTEFSSEEELASGLKEKAGSIPFYQEHADEHVWTTMKAIKDDMIVFDRTGRLVYHLTMPWSVLHYPYVKAAILSAYLDNPCSTLNITNSTELETKINTTEATFPDEVVHDVNNTLRTQVEQRSQFDDNEAATSSVNKTADPVEIAKNTTPDASISSEATNTTDDGNNDIPGDSEDPIPTEGGYTNGNETDDIISSFFNESNDTNPYIEEGIQAGKSIYENTKNVLQSGQSIFDNAISTFQNSTNQDDNPQSVFDNAISTFQNSTNQDYNPQSVFDNAISSFQNSTNQDDKPQSIFNTFSNPAKNLTGGNRFTGSMFSFPGLRSNFVPQNDEPNNVTDHEQANNVTHVANNTENVNESNSESLNVIAPPTPSTDTNVMEDNTTSLKPNSTLIPPVYAVMFAPHYHYHGGLLLYHTHIVYKIGEPSTHKHRIEDFNDSADSESNLNVTTQEENDSNNVRSHQGRALGTSSEESSHKQEETVHQHTSREESNSTNNTTRHEMHSHSHAHGHHHRHQHHLPHQHEKNFNASQPAYEDVENAAETENAASASTDSVVDVTPTKPALPHIEEELKNHYHKILTWLDYKLLC